MRMLKTYLFALLTLIAGFAQADQARDYQLAAGDTIHITVFQNPDLMLDTRVSEGGTITYPLIGAIQIGGLTIGSAEQKIAQALDHGGFVKGPQVNIALVQNIGNQVSVLGYVNRPGSYPLLTFNARLSQLLATAGGVMVAPVAGSNKIILSGTRDGKPFQREIDVASIYLENRAPDDVVLSGGDTIFVPKAPMFYIYGQVNRPGQYGLERNMTVMQALASGGGPTVRGTESRLRLNRRGADGKVVRISPELSDVMEPDDVLYVNESFF